MLRRSLKLSHSVTQSVPYVGIELLGQLKRKASQLIFSQVPKEKEKKGKKKKRGKRKTSSKKKAVI